MRRLVLGVVPGALVIVHLLLFGADLPVAAQWMTLALALALLGALLLPGVRRTLMQTSGLWLVGACFGLTVAIAALSLTTLLPVSPHPAWAWLDTPPAVTVNKAATVIEIAKLLGLACAFLLGCAQAGGQGGGGRRNGAETVRVVNIVGLAYGLASLIVFLSGTQVLAGARLSGGFLSSNSGATVFGMLAVVALASLFRALRRARQQSARRVIADVALPLGCILTSATCLLLTASRTAVAATVLAFAVFVCWELLGSRRRRSPAVIAAAAVAGLVALMAFGAANLLWTRVQSLETDAATRAAIFHPHWHAFLNQPMFGYGLGSFKDINNLIMEPDNYRQLAPIRSLHNVYLQWLEEAGVVGAAPMFATIALIIGIATFRLTRLRAGQTLLRGLIAANLVVLVHGMTDFSLQMPSIAAFWAFLLGVQFAFANGAHNENAIAAHYETAQGSDEGRGRTKSP